LVQDFGNLPKACPNHGQGKTILRFLLKTAKKMKRKRDEEQKSTFLILPDVLKYHLLPYLDVIDCVMLSRCDTFCNKQVKLAPANGRIYKYVRRENGHFENFGFFHFDSFLV
jgi:hypothetical protein